VLGCKALQLKDKPSSKQTVTTLHS